MDSKQAVILLAKVLNPPPFPASPNDGGDSGIGIAEAMMVLPAKK